MRFLLAAALLASCSADGVARGDDCLPALSSHGAASCARCGCCTAESECRFVKKEKQVSITRLGVQDVDFCLPPPSISECKHERTFGSECSPETKVLSAPKLFSWRDWSPCGPPQLATRRKLMKQTITTKLPGYEWVAETLCPSCAQATSQPPSAPRVSDTEAAAPPEVAAQPEATSQLEAAGVVLLGELETAP